MNTIVKSTQRDTVLIVALLVFGALLRLLSLHVGLGRDEGSTYFDIIHSFPVGIIQTVGKSELSPPGFYLLMAAWAHIFGTSELALKFPAFLFGLALIPATYVLGRLFAPGATTGLVAAAIAATAPSAIFYSQDARTYSLAALLCCIASIAYFKLNESQRSSYWVGFVALSVAFVYVQYTGLVFIAVMVVATIYSIFVRRPIGSLVGYVWAFLVIACLTLPLMPSVIFALHIGNPWKPASTNAARALIVNLLANLQAALPVQIPSWRGRLQAEVFAVIGTLAAFDFFFATRSYRNVRETLRQPIATVVVAYVAAATIEAVQGVRVTFAFEPLGWVCLGFWIVSIFERARSRSTRRPVLYHLLRIASALAVVVYLVVETASAIRFGAEASASGIRPYVARGVSTDTVYLITPDFMAPTFGYYARDLRGVRYHGFAHWNHPEYIDLADLTSDWNSPALLSDTEKRIAELRGARWLAVVVANQPWGHVDTAQLKLSQTDRLLNELRRRHQLVDARSFYGRDEPIVVYRFALVRRRGR